MKIILYSFLMAFSQSSIIDLLVCGRRWEKKKRVYLGSLNFIIFFICCIIKLSCQGEWDIYGSYSVFVSYGLLYLLQKGLGVRGRTFFATLCGMIAIALIGDLSALLVIRYVLGYSHLPGWREAGGGIAIIISNGIQLLLAFYVSYSRKHHIFSRQTHQSYRGITSSIILAHNLSLFIVIFLLSFQNQQQIFYTTMIMGEIIFAVGLCYVCAKTFHYDEIKKINRQILILENEAQQNYQCYKKLEKQYQNLHKLRHDFNNLVNTVCVMSQNGEYEEAKKMLNDIDKMLGASSYGR